MQDSEEHRLRIAVSKTIADNLLPDWLVAMHAAAAPEVTVALEVLDAADVAERVRDGSSEVGFAEGYESVGDLRSCAVGSDELLVVTAPGHRLSREEPVCLSRLASIPLVLREDGCGSRATLERAFHQAGLQLAIGAELASTVAIKTLVATGEKVTVLSGLSVRSDVREGRLVALRLDGGPLKLPFRAIWRRSPRPTGPSRTLIDIARRLGQQHSRDRVTAPSPPPAPSR
ncbi:LysR substrate-binding domain-containing protein [Prauserella cavernicola]|nr:LysR substrate-binding domain-containing protein [Prauserella cavernicola]